MAAGQLWLYLKCAMKVEQEHSIAILGRAFAGAIIFAFPVLLTMEMWWFGFYMHRAQLVLFILLGLPLVFGLSHFSGYSRNFTFTERLLDTLVSYAVGFTVATVLLTLIGELGPDVSLSEALKKISIQTLPAAIGAVFSRSLLDAKEEEGHIRRRHVGFMVIEVSGQLCKIQPYRFPDEKWCA